MKNEYDIIDEFGFKEDYSYLNEVIEHTLEVENVTNAVFSIIFIDDEQMHEMNKTYRGIDRTTDVLSFALEDNEDEVFEEFRMLGDIYIAIDVAYDQAIEYNHSREREVCFLATHGLLHLLGYDHMTLEEEKEMFGKQEELLKAYEINR